MTIDPYVRTVLVKVRDEVLISPDRWTQGWFARDRDGSRTGTNDTQATCWCLGGAVVRVAKLAFPDSRSLINRVSVHLTSVFNAHYGCGHSYVTWQDMPERTFEEIRSFLDRALSIDGEAQEGGQS